MRRVGQHVAAGRRRPPPVGPGAAAAAAATAAAAAPLLEGVRDGLVVRPPRHVARGGAGLEAEDDGDLPVYHDLTELGDVQPDVAVVRQALGEAVGGVVRVRVVAGLLVVLGGGTVQSCMLPAGSAASAC